jgi:hypothetical protein
MEEAINPGSGIIGDLSVSHSGRVECQDFIHFQFPTVLFNRADNNPLFVLLTCSSPIYLAQIHDHQSQRPSTPASCKSEAHLRRRCSRINATLYIPSELLALQHLQDGLKVMLMSGQVHIVN